MTMLAFVDLEEGGTKGIFPGPPPRQSCESPFLCSCCLISTGLLVEYLDR